jgi:hypothetical protein
LPDPFSFAYLGGHIADVERHRCGCRLWDHWGEFQDLIATMSALV